MFLPPPERLLIFFWWEECVYYFSVFVISLQVMNAFFVNFYVSSAWPKEELKCLIFGKDPDQLLDTPKKTLIFKFHFQ